VGNAEPMSAPVTSPVFRFADWPNDQVPRRAAGVYAIWRQEESIYAGMSGRGANAADLVAGQGLEDRPSDSRPSLGRHASARRPGDQFSVCIGDRLAVPPMTPASTGT
jgi:hypothetical protein